MPIPELGLAYQIKSIVVDVTRPDSPLKEGDVIKNVCVSMCKDMKRSLKGRFPKKDIEEGQCGRISPAASRRWAA